MSVTRDTRKVGSRKKKVHRKAVTRDGEKLTVTDAALYLGVARQHLSAVIHGKRVSRRLSERYAALLRS